MTLQRFTSIIERIMLGFLVILVVGTPLLFTQYTRSVFEVNKLLLLRVSTIIILVIWVFQYLVLKDNGHATPSENSISILGIKWRKVGLEWAMIAWIGLNVVSTLFSKNLIVSYIGAYDRWEGIITIINYGILWFIFAKWVTKKYQLYILLAAILVSTTFSAIYGILQSFGIDYMNWSVNSAARVFACINNPVHFCAYVGMVVSITIGWLLSMSNKKEPTRLETLIKWGLFLCTLTIYYAQFLSFSRATWLGFCAAMAMFVLIAFKLLHNKSEKHFVFDFFSSLLVIAIFFLLYIFKVYAISLPATLLLTTLLVSYAFYNGITRFNIPKSEILTMTAHIGALPLLFLFQFTNPLLILLQILAAGVWLFQLYKTNTDSKINGWLSKLIILIIFTKLQFLSASLVQSFVLHSILISALYILNNTTENPITEQRKWVLLACLLFGWLLALPTIPERVENIFKTNDQGTSIKAVENAKNRTMSYKGSLEGQSARISMWKSALPWITENWLIGTGPDTIKYMYPEYRRPDYGILEGGHNFTPDRLHNEYLNTLATRGVLATLVYYIALIGGWYWLVLKRLYKIQDQPNAFILLGLISAATVYLVQVLFNFGVVATLVLFYIFVGLAHAIASHDELTDS